MSNSEMVLNLPSYEVEHLDVAREIDSLRKALGRMAENADFDNAEATCIASQQVLYALDEMKWSHGRENSAYLEHIADAERLLEEFGPYREAVLAASGDQAEQAKVFFDNVAIRHKELLRRMGRGQKSVA